MNIPFVYRLILLLLVLCLTAFFDWLVNRSAAKRWKEFAFVVGVGVIGVSFSMTAYAITSRISAEYFMYGKGIPIGEDFYLRVCALAADVGFSGGIIAGAAYVLANSPGHGRCRIPLIALAKLLWIPAMSSILLALGMSWFCRKYDPAHLREELGFIRPAGAGDRFVMVWGMHAGLYIGAIAGVLIGVMVVRRKLKVLASATQAP